MERSPLTRSGPRRLGDEYQDLVALEMILDWLQGSIHYEWLRVEADEAGSLDDVNGLRHGGKLVVRQVKYATNPDADGDPWTWKTLLDQPVSRAGKPLDSLVQKWAKSLAELRSLYAVIDAAVVTNRDVLPEIATELNSDSRLDMSRLTPDTLSRLAEQLGGDSAVRAFCADFRFLVRRPSLEALEEGLLRRFRGLGGTDEGWGSLTRELRRWVVYKDEPKPDGRIRLTDVRQAALWHQLDPLDQRFIVPPDYVVPSTTFHESLITWLETATQGQRVLAAPPGLGKSTYMSYLHAALVADKKPVIRHHYFLALSDRAASERLDHQRAAQSLMHDLAQGHGEALGELANRNPNPADLGSWVQTAGQYYAAHDTSLVILLDGLDHVWRAKRSVEELDELLGQLLPCPPGVVLLLATQPVDVTKLPENLLSVCPREGWIKLPRLSDHSVAQWLRHHEKSLMAPDMEELPEPSFDRLSAAFFRRSAGHPLHLRYTLKALMDRKMLVTEENIDRLPTCPDDDITTYYAALWRSLQEPSRAILHLLTACQFPWPPGGIVACLDPMAARVDQIQDALVQVGHLLTEDALGVRPFHASLPAYVAELAEHTTTYRLRQMRHALDWLRGQAPLYWRWAYEWRLAAELGDEQPLREGPDRPWAISALAARRDTEDTEAILSDSLRLALRQEDLPRAIALGFLRDYVHTAVEFDADVMEALLYPQLLVVDPSEMLRQRLHTQLGNLTDVEVALLAEADIRAGARSAERRCWAELKDRLRNSRVRVAPGTRVTWRSHVGPILQAAALAGAGEYAVRFAAANRSQGYTGEMIAAYARWLRSHRNSRGMRDLLQMATPDASCDDRDEAEPSRSGEQIGSPGPVASTQTEDQRDDDASEANHPVEHQHLESVGSDPSTHVPGTDESADTEVDVSATRDQANREDEGQDGAEGIGLRPEECTGLLHQAVLLAIEEEFDVEDDLAQLPGADSNAFALLYKTLRLASPPTSHAAISFPPAELAALKRFDELERAPEMRDFFVQTFFALLASHITGARPEAEEWLRSIGDQTWARQFVQSLDVVTGETALLLMTSTPVTLEWFYAQLAAIPTPNSDKLDRFDIAFAYQRAATEAAAAIGLDLLVLASSIGGKLTISAQDVEAAFTAVYGDPQVWMRTLVAHRRAWLDEGALTWLSEQQGYKLARAIEPLSERAAQFATLGSVAALHGHVPQASEYVIEAAANLIGHGYHKDLLLDNVLTAIERYLDKYIGTTATTADNQTATESRSQARTWLKRLAPAITFVTEYTDGDETRHLPRFLADVLGVVDPSLLTAYSASFEALGSHRDAVHAFHVFLTSADLSDPAAQAFAVTAADQESVAIVSTRAGQGDTAAQSILTQLEQRLGPSSVRASARSSSRAGSESQQEDTHSIDGQDEEVIEPAEYPPERLDEYLIKARRLIFTREAAIETWIAYWHERGRTREVLEVLEGAVERGVYLYNYDPIFRLVLSYYGKEAAYPWLVRAHIEGYGWQRFISYDEVAVQRWQQVRALYPSKWYSFITDTIPEGRPWPGLTIGHSMVVRLVEYAIFMNQPELAKRMLEATVDCTCDLVSSLPLPTPEQLQDMTPV